MDFYLFSLILGALGLVAMAVSGLGHGHAGHGGHGHDVGDASHGGHGHAAGGDGAQHDAAQGGSGWMWQILSPRMLFSVLTGLGATGLLAEPLLGGVLLFLLALAGGIAFELLAVRPVWNFFFRFASKPALTLESALYDTGTAVTRFDGTGSGVIALEVDGQVLQVLAKLRPEDRDRGLRVRAGDRVLVEEVDGARNRCVVSWAGPSETSGDNLGGELGR